jgi:hypothetical protein
VVVALVVPIEELAEERAGLLERVETFRRSGAILEGLELRLGEGVVVGDAGSAVAGGDAEVAVEERG